MWFVCENFDVFPNLFCPCLQVVVRTRTQEWALSLRPPRPRAWLTFDLTWHPAKGMTLIKDNRLVGAVTRATTRTVTTVTRRTAKFFLGRASLTKRVHRFAKMAVNGFLVAPKLVKKGKGFLLLKRLMLRILLSAAWKLVDVVHYAQEK